MTWVSRDIGQPEVVISIESTRHGKYSVVISFRERLDVFP